MDRWLVCAAALVVVAGLSTLAVAQGDAPERELPAIKPPSDTSVPAAPRATEPLPLDDAAETLWTPKADSPFLPYEAAWPARWVKQGDRLQGVIRAINAPVLNRRGQRSMRPLVAEPEDRADALALRDAAGLTQEPTWNYEGPGYLIFRFEAPIAVDDAPRDVEVFKFVSGRTVKRGEGADAKPTIAIERTWFSFYPAKNSAVRGTALVMPGLWGTPEPIVDSTVAALRRDGWAVVRMLSQPSRFTEQAKIHIDPSDLEGSADRIAELNGQRAAECAYAVEAAFDHVLKRNSALAKLPRVAVGMSGGAMTLPTVIAREAEKYSAAIMVAGGADLWLISTRSNYGELLVHALDVTWAGGKPDEALQRALDAEYLKSAPLDPFHTARALKGKALLMIHGSADMAVPSELGDVLWERLDRPERISMAVGHELLFMNLPTMLPKMCEFLRKSTTTAGVDAAEQLRADPSPTVEDATPR